MTPVNDDDYRTFADSRLDEQNMEAVAANAEQGFDMNQALRHNMYIGWILGVMNDKEIEGVRHAGGNMMEISITGRRTPVTVVIPYPDDTWNP